MAHPSKRKGDGFEREMVARLQDAGIAAERVPLSGAVKTPKFDHDISCPVLGDDWKIECKRRRINTLDAMLGTNDGLFIRGDRSRTLFVTTFENLVKLAKGVTQ